jgi:hypothetical protein
MFMLATSPRKTLPTPEVTIAFSVWWPSMLEDLENVRRPSTKAIGY